MKWGMWLTQVIGSGISLVGRSPWTAADALVRLLAGRPGGRPRARAPVPHSSPERGLPESSTYPVRRNIATSMVRDCRTSAVRMAKLLMRAALADFHETKTFQEGNDFSRFQNRYFTHAQLTVTV